MKHKPHTFVIAKQTLQAGEQLSISISAPKLYTYTPVDMPIHVINGKAAGPTLLVCATIHGDEILGTAIIRRLIKLPMVNQLLKGTLIAIPVVNVYGFINQSRYLPDRRDLNRNFPGMKQGSLASRLAYLFMHEIVNRCTHGIDLHSGARHRCNLPQIRANLNQPGVKRLANAFGAPVILDANLRDGSLRAASNAMDIPILVYEAGEALRFDEMSIRTGVHGILNVMAALKMIPKQHHINKHPHPITTAQSMWVRAPCSGITRPLKLLGRKIEKGETVTVIADPFGYQETPVITPVSGIIVGHSTIPLAHEGEALFHVACFRNSRSLEKQATSLTRWHSDKKD